MNSTYDSTQIDPHEHVDKGKGRAPDPSENTPLLGRASPSYDSVHGHSIPPSRRRLRSQLTYVFCISLCICIIAFVLLALLAYSYASRAADMSPEAMLNAALIFQGPDRIDVLNITGDGALYLNVEGRVGVDAGSLIGVNSNPNEDGLFADIWKSIGRWGIRRLGSVSVNLSTIAIVSKNPPSMTLANVTVSSLELPLTTDPPSGASWLTHVSMPVLVHLTRNSSAIAEFLRNLWGSGVVALHADVPKASIRGGKLSDKSWRTLLQRENGVHTDIRIQIPPTPGLPAPGRNSPFPPISQLITLQSIDISSSSHSLSLHAIASLIDPIPPPLNITTPALPFIVSLPASDLSVPIASVSTAPFSLTHPNITLDITGTLLPLPSSASVTLSNFLTRYLSAKSNPIFISSPLVSDLAVETLFPAPSVRPHILRNVTIHNMKIKPSGTSFLASGTVFARIVLPKGMNVDLDVHRVFPDVLVFDGEVPESIGVPFQRDPPPAPRLPDPLPERAFGHIRPQDWLDSVSVPAELQEGEGSAFNVSATIVDVPLKVLPGRQKEFSNFVGKVIFGSGGALAGILGSAAVSVEVHGLPIADGTGGAGEMELNGLPFQGSVRIGKKSF